MLEHGGGCENKFVACEIVGGERPLADCVLDKALAALVYSEIAAIQSDHVRKLLDRVLSDSDLPSVKTVIHTLRRANTLHKTRNHGLA